MARLKKRAAFEFHGELRNFIEAAQRSQPILESSFWGNRSVKDMIEAWGVPHTEIGEVRIHERIVGLCETDLAKFLRDSERVSSATPLVQVYPYARERPRPTHEPRFILDANLGGLKGYLRAVGIDTVWINHIPDPELVRIAALENRVVLTRDVGVLKRKDLKYGCFVFETEPRAQAAEVLRKYGLLPWLRPFSRCLHCNGVLAPIEKKEVIDRLLPQVQKVFEDFYICAQCERVYWKGSHYERMQRWMDRLVHSLGGDPSDSSNGDSPMKTAG